MVTTSEIVGFGQQQSPLIKGLNAVAQGAGAIRQGLDRRDARDMAAKRQQAYGLLSQAFDDGSDDASTGQLIEQARALDPELTLQVQQMLKKNDAQPSQQVKTEGLEGYSFNPNTGLFSINPEVKQVLEEKALSAASQGAILDAKSRQGINKDVTGLIKNAVEINKTAKDLEKLKKLGGGPASIALVFKFMKALDPQSVVRESEFSTAENSAGVPEGIRNIYNKILNGERLGEAQISQFVDAANALSNSASQSSDIEIRNYLETYENTIPESFKKNLLKRIPSAIDVKVTPTPAPTKAEGAKAKSKYNDNVNKYL